MAGPSMLFVGGIWKTLGLWTSKVVGHFKQGLIGHTIRSVKESAKGDLNCGDPDQGVQKNQGCPSMEGKAVKVKSGLPWRPQGVGDARTHREVCCSQQSWKESEI